MATRFGRLTEGFMSMEKLRQRRITISQEEQKVISFLQSKLSTIPLRRSVEISGAVIWIKRGNNQRWSCLETKPSRNQTGDRSNTVLPSWRDGSGPVATHDKGMYARRTEPGCWTGPDRARD